MILVTWELTIFEKYLLSLEKFTRDFIVLFWTHLLNDFVYLFCKGVANFERYCTLVLVFDVINTMAV